MSSRRRRQSEPEQAVVQWGSDHMPTVADSLAHLKERIQQGVPWHLAMLETAGSWTLPQEDCQGRTYQYLLGGEAFDWLVLAERLCSELDGMVPAEEKEQLLFHGRLPHAVDGDQMEKLLGIPKYHAYMNFWYGVVVEEVLQLAVEEEVHKEQRSRGRSDLEQVEDMAWSRLYEKGREALLQDFRQQRGLPQTEELTLAGMKEFTYWLFKLRVHKWDPARVASDTRKALDRLDSVRRQG